MLTLKSANKSATFSGKAVFNSFTKTYEIVVETTTNDPVFNVLTTGNPVAVSSPARTPSVWPTPNVEQTIVWHNDCTTRSEH